jgi:hypothetical protein
MIAKLAYLTSPKPGLYILHVQLQNQIGTSEFEISEAHLANIIIDGASFALRKIRRVPVNSSQESADGSDNRAQ